MRVTHNSAYARTKAGERGLSEAKSPMFVGYIGHDKGRIAWRYGLAARTGCCVIGVTCPPRLKGRSQMFAAFAGLHPGYALCTSVSDGLLALEAIRR